MFRNEKKRISFFPELLQLAETVAEDLAQAGYDRIADYSSIDAMHDVHGIEVCGIRSAEDTVEVTRILLRRISEWNAGWIHQPSRSSLDGWVARIQRDLDPEPELWDVD